MDQKEAIIKAKNYILKINDIITIKKAFLFGSYVIGNPRHDSDIDIGIFVNPMIDDYYDILKKLYRARRNIDVRIEPHLFMIGHDKSGFSEEIEKTGLPLSP